MYDVSERLNARIDDELARKLETLRRRLGMSTTDIVRRSIEHFYEVSVRSEASPAAIIEASGLVGCAEGAEDLSTRYKDELASTLAGKGIARRSR
jgi:predicted transcriptional regulator